MLVGMLGDSAAMMLGDVLVFLIEKGPGRTEADLAQAIFADAAYADRVGDELRALSAMNLVEKRDDDSAEELYRYFPKEP